jgi:hypothetical protein
MSANIDLSPVLDETSRLRLRIFAFKLMIMIPVSIALAGHRHYPLPATLSFFCFWQGVFAGIAAVFHRHRHNAQFLTAWDEMAAFFGLGALMRLVDTVAG